VTGRTCRIPDCGRGHYARDMCQMHYRRWQRLGADDVLLQHIQAGTLKRGRRRLGGRAEAMLAPVQKPGPQARVPECHPDRRHAALGMCAACYQRHRRASRELA